MERNLKESFITTRAIAAGRPDTTSKADGQECPPETSARSSKLDEVQDLDMASQSLFVHDWDREGRVLLSQFSKVKNE